MVGELALIVTLTSSCHSKFSETKDSRYVLKYMGKTRLMKWNKIKLIELDGTWDGRHEIYRTKWGLILQVANESGSIKQVWLDMVVYELSPTHIRSFSRTGQATSTQPNLSLKPLKKTPCFLTKGNPLSHTRKRNENMTDYGRRSYHQCQPSNLHGSNNTLASSPFGISSVNHEK